MEQRLNANALAPPQQKGAKMAVVATNNVSVKKRFKQMFTRVKNSSTSMIRSNKQTQTASHASAKKSRVVV